MEEYTNSCRLCLRRGAGSGVDIFESRRAKQISELFRIELVEVQDWPKKTCKACMKILDDVQRLRDKVVFSQARLAEVAAENIKGPDPEPDYPDALNEEPDVEDCKKDLHFPEVEMKLEPDVIVEEESQAENDESEEEEYKPKPKKIAAPKRRKRKLISAQTKPNFTENKEERKALENLMREMGLLLCHMCGENTDSFSELQRHQKDVHNFKEASVYCCKRKISRSSVINHMKYHLNPDAFKCQCGKVYITELRLRMHKLVAHLKPEEVQCSCEICGKGFARSYLLDNHRIMHHQPPALPCPQCDHMSRTSSTLRNHIKLVHEKNLGSVCEVCGKRFTCSSKLEDHLQKVHSEFKAVECEICHKFVFDKSTHINRSHKAVKIQCEQCEYTGTKYTMKGHVLKHHSGIVVRLPCPICEKVYTSKKCLQEHVNGHMGIKYKCEFCPVESTTTTNRYAHMSQKHPVEYAERRAKQEAAKYQPKVKKIVQ